MNLSDHQVEAIRAWAEGNPYVTQVRLFGSRAKGTARGDSDADLALTIPGTKGETPLGILVGEKSGWERSLSIITGLQVRLELYDVESAPRLSPTAEKRVSCCMTDRLMDDERSIS
jgi:predicted nucleotidyltransferase